MVLWTGLAVLAAALGVLLWTRWGQSRPLEKCLVLSLLAHVWIAVLSMTIHFAVGSSYPETGGKNESSIHWDMLCDMSESEITIDGEVFYRNGKPVIWS